MLLSELAVMATAWRRPYYLRPVLESWANADGIDQVRRFVISLGPTDRVHEQMELIQEMSPRFACGLEVLPQSEHAVRGDGIRKPFGPHRAIAEAVTHCFGDPRVGFVVAGEEDVVVSSDVLSYMRWAATVFQEVPSVLLACAHSRGGQGWDLQTPARDGDADQEAVRFGGTSMPGVGARGATGGRPSSSPSGTTTAIRAAQFRAATIGISRSASCPGHRMRCVVPDASRSQNIGEREGWSSSPDRFSLLQAQSFRQHRDNPQYKLVK